MARTPVIAAEVGIAIRDLFPSAADRTMDALVRAGSVGSVRRKDRILGEELAPRLVLILDGYAATWRSDTEGRSRIVGLAGPGELAGLRALSPLRAPIELVAMTDARCATWHPDNVLAIARTDAGLATALLELALLAGDALLARTDSLSIGSAFERVVELVSLRREIVFDPVRPILVRSQIAELTGASKEMVDRILGDLETDGIVERVGRTGLVLRDETALDRLAEMRSPF